jgi:hypothetical protein
LGGDGDHLGPGQQLAGQGDDLAPDLVLGEAPEREVAQPGVLRAADPVQWRRRPGSLTIPLDNENTSSTAFVGAVIVAMIGLAVVSGLR